MPNRHASSNKYRYGFNGKEKDDEIKGEGNSIDFGARMYDSRLGRWLRPDPLDKKYPYESSFSAFGNNPILYVDPDGRDIIIYLANGTFFKYEPGMSVPTDAFAKKVVESLNKIHSTSEGAEVISTLVSSSNKFNITEAKFLISPYSTNKTQFSLGKHKEYDATFKKHIKNKEFSKADKLVNDISELSIGIYNGNYVLAWDINNFDGVKMNFTLALGHELFHGYQFEIGRLDGSFIGAYIETTGKVPLLEAQAVGFENYLRGSLFGDTKYGKTRGSYSFKPIGEYFEQPDWWDYLLGFDKLDVKEFKEGGKAYDIWKNNFSEKAKEKGEKVLDKK